MLRRKLIFAVAAAAIGFATAVSLGNWQTRRGDAKLAMQAQADAAERAEPFAITASRISIEDAAAKVPLRVSVSGVFDPTGTVYLDNRTLRGVAGYYVITPLVIRDDLPAVLIDRGWKARTMGEREKAVTVATPAGRIDIEGLAVAGPSSLFELAGTVNTGVPGFWQNLDYANYEQVTKRSVARFIVRQTRDAISAGAVDDLRREWPRAASGVDKHRGYALQWYALASLIAALAVYFGWKAWRMR